MLVETYEIEEINASEASTMAADAEAMELIEKLGLTGQQTLSNPETLTRQPYAQMNREEIEVWSFHCPERTKLENYSLSPIPLRVLQVAALCRDQNFFKELLIWHPKQVTNDPLLVGYAHDDQWNGRPYLLARWGKALEPYDKLAAQARDAFIRKFTLTVDKLASQIAAAKATAPSLAQAHWDSQNYTLPVAYHLEA